MNELVIVGAGGTARDIAEAVEDLNRVRPQWTFLGFLDDNPDLKGKDVDGHPVLGAVADATRIPGAQFVIGIAHAQRPGGRAALLERLGIPVSRLGTVVHPSAQVSPRAELGPGCAILGGAIVSRGVRLGRSVVVCQNAAVFHDSILGDFVDVAPGAIVSGFVHVEAGAFIGSNSVIMSAKRVGAGSIVGMGCVVQQDVPARCFVAAQPVRVLPRG